MATFFDKGYVPPTKKHKQTEIVRLDKGRAYEKDGRERKFIPQWKTEFPWLEYDDKKGMMCSTCVKYESSSHCGPQASFVAGSKTYRKTSIRIHELSEQHIYCSKKAEAHENPSEMPAVHTLQLLNKCAVNQMKLKFRNVHYLCKKGRPFLEYSSLCQLDESKGLETSSQYNSNKSATIFCEFIAEAERSRIRKTLKKNNFISAISDGTTDSSFQEAEIVYLRTCHSGNISVYFSLVKNVPRGDSFTIANVMVEGLKNLCTDYKCKLVGTGTDGASTMMGAKSGAVERLRQITERPYIIGIHCSGHKLELAYKDALKQKIALFSKVDLFLLNLYYFYRNSNVTRTGLKDSYKALGMKILLPTRLGGTRWLGHMKKAIGIFLRGYAAFVQHLGQLQNRDTNESRTDRGNKAIHFYKASTTKDMWLMFHFLLDVLTVLADVSLKFQDRTAQIQDILTEITMTVKSLEKLKTRDGINLRKALAEPPSDLHGNDVAFISARGRLLSTLIDALHRRFTDNPGILASCSAFSLSLFPSTEDDAEEYGDDDVDQLVDHFHPALEAANVDSDKIAKEWIMLKAHMRKRFADPREATWEDVNRKLGQICPNVLKLVDLIMTIPASSADAERGFSHLKNIKTDRRSRLLDRHLSDQMTIMLESADVKDFDPVPAISLWNAEPRRLRKMQEKDQSTLNVKKTSTESQAIIIDVNNNVESEKSESVDHTHDVCSQMSSRSHDTEAVLECTEYDSQSIDQNVIECAYTDTGCDKGIQVNATVSEKYVQVGGCPGILMSHSSKQLVDKSVQVESLFEIHSLASHSDEIYDSDDDYAFENESFDESDLKMDQWERVNCAAKSFADYCEVCTVPELI